MLFVVIDFFFLLNLIHLLFILISSEFALVRESDADLTCYIFSIIFLLHDLHIIFLFLLFLFNFLKHITSKMLNNYH